MRTKAQILAILSLAAPVAVALAQSASSGTSAPPPSGLEQTIQDIKHPVSWLTWGGDLRLRNEYFNNAQTLTSDPALNPSAGLHSQDYFRFRGRLWTSIAPVEQFSLNARLAAEPRLFMEPSSAGTFRGRSGMEWRYGIIDNLNVQWKQPLDLPATLTVGRQDIFLGDGWLVGDGTPADGSWTYFLDAARLTYDLKEQHTTIDAIGFVQNARADAWLPIIDNQDRFVTDQNEKGAILWVANKTLSYANLDGYFIYKHDTRVNNSPSAPFGDNGDIYTIGGRVSGLVQEHFKYSLEGAYQFGEKQDPNLKNSVGSPNEFRDLNAFGVNSKLAYLVKDKLNNQVSFSFEFLSGDDPTTQGDEMFDVLWGRWPRWSELYDPYSYIPETRVGQTANYYRFGPGWSCNPIKNMDVLVNYNVLFADQDVPTRAGNLNLFTQDGNFRGHFLQSVLKYKFCQHVSGHLWGEVFFPGDFYTSRQMMTFLRAEMLFTF